MNVDRNRNVDLDVDLDLDLDLSEEGQRQWVQTGASVAVLTGQMGGTGFLGRQVAFDVAGS